MFYSLKAHSFPIGTMCCPLAWAFWTPSDSLHIFNNSNKIHGAVGTQNLRQTVSHINSECCYFLFQLFPSLLPVRVSYALERNELVDRTLWIRAKPERQYRIAASLIGPYNREKREKNERQLRKELMKKKKSESAEESVKGSKRNNKKHRPLDR